MKPYTVKQVAEKHSGAMGWFGAKDGTFCDYFHVGNGNIDASLTNWRVTKINEDMYTLYATNPSSTQDRPRLLVKRPFPDGSGTYLTFCKNEFKDDASDLKEGRFYDLRQNALKVGNDGKLALYKQQGHGQNFVSSVPASVTPIPNWTRNKTAIAFELTPAETTPGPDEMTLGTSVAGHFEAVTAGLAHEYNMRLLRFVEAEEMREAEKRGREAAMNAFAALLSYGDTSGPKHSKYVLLKRTCKPKLGAKYLDHAPTDALFIQPMVLPIHSKGMYTKKSQQTAGIGKLGIGCIHNAAHGANPDVISEKGVDDLYGANQPLGTVDPSFYTVCLGALDEGVDKYGNVPAFQPPKVGAKRPPSDVPEVKEVLDGIVEEVVASTLQGGASAVSGVPYNYIRGTDVVKRTTRSLTLGDWMGHETFKAYAERLRTRMKRGRPDEADGLDVLPEDQGALHGKQIRAVSCSMDHRLHGISRFCTHVTLCLIVCDENSSSLLGQVIHENSQASAQ